MLGPQDELFTEKGLFDFKSALYTVTQDSNRMAAKLNGAAIEARAGVDILSDGIVEGSVQISANGQPIVMLTDHQSTGGYAKIATVIPCDIPTLAQVRPGQLVGFRVVTVEEGTAACKKKKINGLISRRRSTMTDYSSASPKAVRELIREGKIATPTTGMCDDYAQGNLVVLPKELAWDFLLFCQRNPKSCPLLEVADAGSRTFPIFGAGSDIARDIPKYRVYENGVMTGEYTDVSAFFDDPPRAGQLFNRLQLFESALLEAAFPSARLKRA